MLDVGNILRQFVEAVPETVLGDRYVDLSLTPLKVSKNAAAEMHLEQLRLMQIAAQQAQNLAPQQQSMQRQPVLTVVPGGATKGDGDADSYQVNSPPPKDFTNNGNTPEKNRVELLAQRIETNPQSGPRIADALRRDPNLQSPRVIEALQRALS